MSSCPPGTISYTVLAGDTVYQIAMRYGTTVAAVAELNPGVDVDKISIGQVICVRPSLGFTQNNTRSPIGRASFDLNNLLRLLWEQHVDWTKSVIFSTVYNLPDLEDAINRYLRNAKDFETVLKPIYGDTVAARYADLLSEHQLLGAEYVKAIKDNDSIAAAYADKKLYANADEMAAFLHEINPYWSEDEWRKLLYDHHEMSKRETVDLIKGSFAESILTYDNAEKNAMQMADLMTKGIVKGVTHRRAKKGLDDENFRYNR